MTFGFHIFKLLSPLSIREQSRRLIRHATRIELTLRTIRQSLLIGRVVFAATNTTTRKTDVPTWSHRPRAVNESATPRWGYWRWRATMCKCYDWSQKQDCSQSYSFLHVLIWLTNNAVKMCSPFPTQYTRLSL